ncbi:c-type cytochrome domain-containing protein [Prosthecobacter vanneervenii]|uniref:WD40 repeat protein n=1 Tax=Prosthecobacter vanneervenii TaxID=48466 RepID=A0A7W7YD95_9BACT|nr:c-type cytochrome domain-containing protein [Prosthecobacter vanneervenii]MBB5033969.1 WD40 repeat protein [Prosthecobacter vanneervenii]
MRFVVPFVIASLRSPLRGSIRFAVLAVSLCSALHSSFVVAAAPATIDYDQQVRPFLKDNCIACHNKTTTKGGLNMETPELMVKGGESDKGIVPGKGADSIIYQAAAHSWDSEMPPKGNKVGAVNLTPAQLALLKTWIDQGAKASPKKVQVIAWEPLPAGLQPIYAVAVAPQGDFAAAARANQISIYHLPTQSLVTKLTDEALLKSGLYKQPGVAHRDLVQSVAFSPDGTRLATGSFREVKLWKRTIPASPALAPSTKFTATQEADNSIKLTETAGGKLVAHIKSDLAAEQALAQRDLSSVRAALEVTYQNEAIKKAEADATEQANRLKKANELAELAKKALEEKKKDIKPKEDAKTAAEKAAAELAAQVAKVPADKPDAALAKKNTEAQEKATKAASDLKLAQEALTRAEAAITDTANEITLVTENEKKAKQAVVDAKARLEVVKKEAEKAKTERDLLAKTPAALKKAKALQFSANGLELIAEQEGGPPLAWSTVNGRPIVPGSTAATWSLERVIGTGDGRSEITDRANSLAFSPDGKMLAIGSGEPSRSGDITLWEVATGKLQKTYAERHLDSVFALDFSPDGKMLASGGADKALRITDLSTGKVVKVFEGHTHHVLGVSWRADGRLLASSGADNVVKVWDWTTGDRRKSVDGWDKEVTGIHYLGAADQIATSAGDSKLRLITSDGGEVKKITGITSFLQSLATSKFGDVVLGGDQDGNLRAWDVATAKEIAMFKP